VLSISWPSTILWIVIALTVVIPSSTPAYALGIAADQQCSGEYDPTVYYPKRDASGILGLIGLPCIDITNGNEIRGQCVAFGKCEAKSADGGPIRGLPEIPVVSTIPGPGVLSIDSSLLSANSMMYTTSDLTGPSPTGQFQNLPFVPNANPGQPVIPPAETFTNAPYSPFGYDSLENTAAFNNGYLSTLSSAPPPRSNDTFESQANLTPSINQYPIGSLAPTPVQPSTGEAFVVPIIPQSSIQEPLPPLPVEPTFTPSPEANQNVSAPQPSIASVVTQWGQWIANALSSFIK